MSLIVEDGTIVAGAESFASVSDADTRLAARGFTTWATMVTAEKEQALRRGTDYMQQHYRGRWKGARTSALQMLDWPRVGVALDDLSYSQYQYVISPNIVPNEVKFGCIDIAFKAASGDLSPDIEREVTKEKIGPIEIEYRPGANQSRVFRSIDATLKPYLAYSALSGRLVRA